MAAVPVPPVAAAIAVEDGVGEVPRPRSAPMARLGSPGRVAVAPDGPHAPDGPLAPDGPPRGRTLSGMRTPRALVPLLVLGLALSACRGDPAPAAWAASVCETLTPWRAEIGSLTDRAQKQMDAATTPAQVKENLVRLLSRAEAASDAARARVAGSGVPDVDGGEAVAREFEASLAAVRDAYGRARVAIERLSTGDDRAFYDGVVAAMATLTEEYSRSALDTTTLSSAELKRAFAEVPECR
jgi:hypothetical protein